MASNTLSSEVSIWKISGVETRDTYYVTGDPARLPAQLAGRWGQMKCNSVRCREKYFVLGSPELKVLVDFVFPWGIEYPVVFLPQGLFTLWCLQIS